MTLDPQRLIGQTAGSFTIDELIGQGAFTWVFRGHHTTDQTPVALKVLRPRYSGDPEFERRFRNESTVAQELQHPNIVRILEVGHEGENTFFAMDYYADSLAARLDRDGPLGERQIVEVARDVADGLRFAHDAGFVHRDIKVENILLTPQGRAVIADFGIARTVSGYANATGTNMTIGTPHYVSPEQAQGRKLDGRSDLYGLGVTLYKATTGDVPFRSTDWFELARMHVEDAPAAPRENRPEISVRLERIILRLLAKHPDDRYPSASELISELDEIRRLSRATVTFGLDAVGEAEAPTPITAAPWFRWVVRAAAVLVVILVAALVIVLGTR